MYELDVKPGSLKGAMKESGATSRDLWYVPIDSLKVLDGFNVRTKNEDYEAHIASLGESILANGFRPNKALGVFVNGSDIVIYDGHCRFAAVQYANARGAQIEKLPCVAAPPGTSAEDLTVELHVANSGKPLSPIELGTVIKRLIGYGLEEAQIAKRLSITTGYVTQLLSLMQAPVELRNMVEGGTMAAATAVDIIRKSGGGSAAVEAAEAAVSEARAQGSERVTKRHLATATAFSKKAKKLHLETARALLKLHKLGLFESDLFTSLSTESMDEIMLLISDLEAHEETDNG